MFVFYGYILSGAYLEYGSIYFNDTSHMHMRVYHQPYFFLRHTRRVSISFNEFLFHLDSTTDGSPRCQSTSSYIDDLMLEDISSDDDILCTALDEAEAEVAATLPSTSSTKAETLRLGTIVTEEDIKKRGVRR